MRSDREKDIFSALDRFILIVVISSLAVLTALYFILPLVLPEKSAWLEFFRSIITNIIPVAILFIISYLTYRRFQSIRADYETDTLAKKIATLVSSSLTPSITDQFLEEYPPEYKQQFADAAEVWIFGVTLTSTIRDNYSLIETKLRNAHKIRALLVNPLGEAVQMSDMRDYAKSAPERTRIEIINSLESLCELKRVAQDKLEIRTIQHPLGFGATAINPASTTQSLIYIQHYAFKTKGAPFQSLYFVVEMENGMIISKLN